MPRLILCNFPSNSGRPMVIDSDATKHSLEEMSSGGQYIIVIACNFLNLQNTDYHKNRAK